MRKFIIERELPAIGSAERQALREAAQKSNATLKELGPDIQWVESYVANDKTFCVYLARDEAIIQEHAKRSGFPANKITEVRRMIDPTTATEVHKKLRPRCYRRPRGSGGPGVRAVRWPPWIRAFAGMTTGGSRRFSSVQVVEPRHVLAGDLAADGRRDCGEVLVEDAL